MKKFLILAALILTAVCLLASCGGKTGGAETASAEESGTAEPESETTRARVTHSTLPAITTNEGDEPSGPSTAGNVTTQPEKRTTASVEIITDGFFVPERSTEEGASLFVTEDAREYETYPLIGLN